MFDTQINQLLEETSRFFETSNALHINFGKDTDSCINTT